MPRSREGTPAVEEADRPTGRMPAFGIEAVVYDGVRVEPTDDSMRRAVAHARAAGPRDAFVVVGGGSGIDTARAVNLPGASPRIMDEEVAAGVLKRSVQN